MKKEYIIIIIAVIVIAAFFFFPSKASAEILPVSEDIPNTKEPDINGSSILQDAQQALKVGAGAAALIGAGSQVVGAVGTAFGIGSSAAETVVATTLAATAEPAAIASSVSSAVLEAGGTASEAAAAASAASEAAAGGATVGESAAVGIGSIGMAFAVVGPIALAWILFDTFGSGMSEYNKPEHLLAVNMKTQEEEMPKYSVWGSGGTVQRDSPTTLQQEVGTRFGGGNI